MKNQTTNKWNWGHNIVVAFVLFCGFVIYIVVRAFQQNIDLVSDTYYLEELAYQQRIDQRSNLAHSGLEVQLKQTAGEVILQFPKTFASATGEIHFYHPSRELFDKRYEIVLNADNQQPIGKHELVKGRYKVKINWVAEDKAYFQEAEIFLK